MRETLLALYQLQQIDSAVLDIEKSAEQYPTQIGVIESGLDSVRSELGSLNSQYESKSKELESTEGQIREDSGKQQKWKRRLSDLKSPREYQMMSREVDQAERVLKEQEDRSMLLMSELEEMKKQIDDKASRLREDEERDDKRVKELREQQARKFAEADKVRQSRNDLVKSVPPRVLSLYEKIRERRQGVAVALAKEGKCMGCNFVIRPQMMVEIRKLNSIEQCPNCSRLLVLSVLVLGKENQAEA